MPELPEVQALVDTVGSVLRGAVVVDVSLRSVAALKTYQPPLRSLTGRVLTGAQRRGKFLVVAFDPVHLVLHLARGGWLRLRARPTSSRPALRGPLALSVTFENGVALEVTEQGTEKRLALYLVRDPSEVPGIARLGIDALDPALTEERLGVLLAGATGTVKSVLADQGVVAGVGNAYSDEILHSARLSPFRKAAALEATEVALLHAAMRSVLSEAVAAAGAGDVATLKDAKRMTMRVHGRGGGRCPVCGDVIRDVWFSSRSFQYCPGCQTGGRVYADRRMSRLLR